MSLFSGYQRQLNAIPSAPARAPQVKNTVRRGLFGGRGPDLGTIGTMLLSGTQGLDARRTRDQEQQAATVASKRAMMRQEQARSMFGDDPIAQELYASGNEEFLKSLGGRYRDETLAEGTVRNRGTATGSQNIGSAPVIERFDDRFGTIDPMNPQAGAQYSAPRTSTFAEETGRINATNPVSVAPGSQLRDPISGNLIASGAERVFSASDGTQLYREGGGMLAENQKDLPPAPSSTAQTTAAMEAITNTRSAISRARDQAGFLTTGPLASLPFNTPARDLNATLDTIKANLSFNELAKMRANSPTGGALGSIAVRELDLLGSTVASLDQAQSQEELERSFSIIEQSLERWEKTVSQGGGAQTQPQAPSRAALEAEARRRGLLR